MHSHVFAQARDAGDARAHPRLLAAAKPVTGLPIRQLYQKCACGGGCQRCQATSHDRDQAKTEAEATEVSQLLDSTRLQSTPKVGEPGDELDRVADQVTEQIVRTVAPRAPAAPAGLGQPLQAKLRINEPGDVYEQEADRVAEQVMRPPDVPVYPETSQSRAAQLVQRVSGSTAGVGTAPQIVQDVLSSPGEPLDAATRAFFEGRLGHDFRQVRVHSDAKAGISARAIGALAYSIGQHIAFGQRQYRPHTNEGKRLLAHELAHVVQQVNGSCPTNATGAVAGPTQRVAGPIIQRRLLATGTPSDIQDMLSLLQPAIGHELNYDPMTTQIEIAGVGPNPAASSSAERIITQIIDDRKQDAEIQVGKAQTYSTEVPYRDQSISVEFGQFPFPRDLTGPKIQTVDIDDILAVETGSPGHGIAALIHEIAENYYAHSLTPQAGVDRFKASHKAGVEAESDVAQELVGPGRRVAGVSVSIPGGAERVIVDFEYYYVVIDQIKNAVTGSADVGSARKVSRVNVATYTIDGFASGMRAVPPSGGASITSAARDLGKFDTATVRIEGFTDDSGTDNPNVELATHRAELTRDAIISAGAKGGKTRFHTVGYGAINFVAPNNNDANRALNRRVVVIIDRPDI